MFLGRWFYIKNSYTGKYLDVNGGNATPGTNVHQYEFNGTNAQKWFFYYEGNGEYTICSYVGSTISNNTLYLNYALDVDNGVNADGTNIHLYTLNSGITQRYGVIPTGMGTYSLRTKCSSWDRCVTINTSNCTNGINVMQRLYNNDTDQDWILEPVDKYNANAVIYAKQCYNKRLPCFPDCYYIGGDCANFVSQCLLNKGVHMNSNWYIEKKNNLYHTPEANTTQLEDSWNYDYSWINANSFKNYWMNNAVRTYSCTGNYALSHMYDIYYEDYEAGDVIQYCNSILGFESSAAHTMLITDYGAQQVNGTLYPSYFVTYHSNDTLDRALTVLYSNYSNYYFRMYQID